MSRQIANETKSKLQIVQHLKILKTKMIVHKETNNTGMTTENINIMH